MRYLGKALGSAQSSQHQTLQTRLSSVLQGTGALKDDAANSNMRYNRPKTSAAQQYHDAAGVLSPTGKIHASIKNMSR